MFQKWFPSKCISRLVDVRFASFVGFSSFASFVGFVTLVSSFSFAESKRSSKKGSDVTHMSHARATRNLPPLLKEVEARYAKSQTLTADFSQTNQNAALVQKKTSSGKIFFKRPSKIRWETVQPDKSLFISDGKNSWFYTPPFDEDERGQLIERKASKVQSRLTTALLSGSFSIAQSEEMKIKELTPSIFQLTPKAGSAGSVTQITLAIDPRLKLIQKVTLDHRGGNHTEIELSHIDLGPPLADSLFTFDAPPNTDRVDDEEKE